MKVSGLSIYPLKSITGIELAESAVTKKGLEFDRHWALVDDSGKVVTARDFPKLLHLSPKIAVSTIEILQNGIKVLNIPFEIDSLGSQKIQIFSSSADGLIHSNEINSWFSNYLGISVRLLVVDKNKTRAIQEKHGGLAGDVVGFADQNPILLISEASLGELNSRLKTPVTMTHFRPNIIVSGCAPYAEDKWKTIKFEGCEFEIVQPCQRCVFTTIDPKTAVKDPNSEPLKTLATYRKVPAGGIAFGVHAIPREIGSIKVGDSAHFS